MPTNEQSQQQRQAIEDAATTILAYLDMGNKEEVERILYTMDRPALGLVITTWYQMCVAYRGVDETATIAQRTAEYLQAKADSYADITEAAAESYSVTLLNHLSRNKLDQYAKAWKAVIHHTPDISADVAARLLGFTRGIVGGAPQLDCE